MDNKQADIHHYRNGLQLMDLIHVDDVCKAISLACKSKRKFGIYNIASGIPIKADEIARNISKITHVRIIHTKKNMEANHVFFDISK